MSNYQVPEPIINSPYDEPKQHWNIVEGEQPQLLLDRRPAVYFYRDPRAKSGKDYRGDRGVPIELKLVNLIRERVKAWRNAGYPGVTRTTSELLQWWRREGRDSLSASYKSATQATNSLNPAPNRHSSSQRLKSLLAK